MRIILQERVTNLGKIGDIVTVKPGYARNLLIPYGKATMATEENIKLIAQRRAELEQKEAEKLSSAEKRAEQLRETVLQIMANASEEGKLFGSIAARDIAEAAKAIGIELHKNEVKLPSPIRMAGEHEVDVMLHNEVVVQLKVMVEISS